MVPACSRGHDSRTQLGLEFELDDATFYVFDDL